ncbi:hypothetical protein Lalb_Chr04g0257131 [Lupinus albus]|uniref:Uncharacterized protein n=1 Tax=Lupinus albus TaxID=3870 RepID=A0A6A4QLW1_LUPAL|nr:hypothetical protein Lalb_Chr04g0257131 [Lupinus albus]
MEDNQKGENDYLNHRHNPVAAVEEGNSSPRTRVVMLSVTNYRMGTAPFVLLSHFLFA